MAKFDIIIPVYNAEFYLRKCLDSIFNQNHQDFRVIAIDDKSTDNSLAILEDYQRRFKSQMIVFSNPINMGAGFCRNKGLDVADGDYVTFLDSDDYLSENLLKKMNEVAQSYYPDLIICEMKLVFHGLNMNFFGGKVPTNKTPELILPKEKKTHIYQERPNAAAKFFKRQIINSYFPTDLKWEDYAFAVPYLVNSQSIYLLNEVGYFYNVNLFGTTVTDMLRLSPRILDIFTASDKINENISEELQEYFKQELRITRTMNCLQRLRDLSFVRNVSEEDKKRLANALVNLINIREGDYQQLDWYHQKKAKKALYRYQMNKVESYLDSSLQQETNEEIVKKRIKTILKKY